MHMQNACGRLGGVAGTCGPLSALAGTCGRGVVLCVSHLSDMHCSIRSETSSEQILIQVFINFTRKSCDKIIPS